MIRALRNTAAVLAATALVSLPATATAADWGNGSAPVFVVNNVHQTALGDIFNAGHDNTVGSNNGAGDLPGAGAPILSIANYGTPPPVNSLTLMSSTGTAVFPKFVLYGAVADILPGQGVSEAVYSGFRVPVRIRTDGSNLECLAGCRVTYERDQQTATVR